MWIERYRVIALRAGKLIDGTGAEPLRDAVVLLEYERVARDGAAEAVDIPPTAEALAAGDRTVIPVLIEYY